MLQVRGSIPLYWSQQGSRLSKPDILLQTFDPLYRCAPFLLCNPFQRRKHAPVVMQHLAIWQSPQSQQVGGR